MSLYCYCLNVRIGLLESQCPFVIDGRQICKILSNLTEEEYGPKHGFLQTDIFVLN